MKKFIITLCALFVCTTIRAQTETINWYKDGELYDTTTCESGGDIDLPLITPTKRGYTFQGWWAYTPIEYLESTGTQYIDTGIVPKLNMQFKCEAAFNNVNDTSFIFGSRTSGTSATSTDQFYTGVQKGIVFFTSGTSRIDLVSSAKTDTYYEIITTNSYATVDGGRSAFLFGFNILGNDPIHYANKKIKYAQIYDNNTLVRDFVPVLDYNGTPCMFDKVSETFFYNKGTGDFIAGPIVSE